MPKNWIVDCIVREYYPNSLSQTTRYQGHVKGSAPTPVALHLRHSWRNISTGGSLVGRQLLELKGILDLLKSF